MTFGTTCDLPAWMSDSTMASGPFRAVLPAAAAVLVAAAIARAESPDDQFLGLLSKHGLNVGPPDQMIAIAHERCDDDRLSRSSWYIPPFGRSPSPFMVAMTRITNELKSQGLTVPQVGQFMRDAITVYCPGAKDG
ncbi:DUF732 domain-containing protein [Mycobacterium fragae]|nr:DUF732 domain-containing protein [Mycobacterium fragae]MCV7399784.1 DUF732 domain-containing protein [Mycobacterium fragae]